MKIIENGLYDVYAQRICMYVCVCIYIYILYTLKYPNYPSYSTYFSIRKKTEFVCCARSQTWAVFVFLILSMCSGCTRRPSMRLPATARLQGSEVAGKRRKGRDACRRPTGSTPWAAPWTEPSERRSTWRTPPDTWPALWPPACNTRSCWLGPAATRRLTPPTGSTGRVAWGRRPRHQKGPSAGPGKRDVTCWRGRCQPHRLVGRWWRTIMMTSY